MPLSSRNSKTGTGTENCSIQRTERILNTLRTTPLSLPFWSKAVGSREAGRGGTQDIPHYPRRQPGILGFYAGKGYSDRGRLPQAANELVLSKQYFDDHPGTKVGDTLTLPIGQRMYQGKVCMETDGYHEDETFRQTGTKTYKIVGILDVTTSSSVPAYTGMSYLDTKTVNPGR